MDHVPSFLASMPEEYRTTFSAGAMAVHAEIVAGRGERSSITARWDANALCVVADDSPGLFARITEALVAHEIDIVAAQAFCRTRADGVVEAVDFLWVNQLRDEDVGAIGALIDALVRGEAQIATPHRPPRRRRAGGITRVKFDRDEATGGAILTVEAADRPGLLLAITKTIFVARLQIVGLHAKSERGSAIDRFHIAEIDGKPMSPERALELQAAILEAVDVTASQAGSPSLPGDSSRPSYSDPRSRSMRATR
jgi:UTP:GlnB (protein PII) uridylyltransferase